MTIVIQNIIVVSLNKIENPVIRSGSGHFVEALISPNGEEVKMSFIMRGGREKEVPALCVDLMGGHITSTYLHRPLM